MSFELYRLLTFSVKSLFYWRKDKFMRAFLSDMCLRPSCYDCPSRGAHRVSDFTIADFWGIQKIRAKMGDFGYFLMFFGPFLRYFAYL